MTLFFKFSSILVHNREVKISLRQRQRVRERIFLCADIFISYVIPGFIFVIVVVDDEVEAMSRSSICVQNRNEKKRQRYFIVVLVLVVVVVVKSSPPHCLILHFNCEMKLSELLLKYIVDI